MAKLRCCGCKKRFPKESMIKLPGGNFHSINCASSYGNNKQTKARERQASKAKRETKKKHAREKRDYYEKDIKTRRPAAQNSFNAFIRYRDKDDNCMSCNRSNSEVQATDGWKIGGAWDCGHYLTRGAYPELRFEELNAHKQCKSCNGGSGKYTKKARTVNKQYRINLIEKIGFDQVEWLEGPHTLKKYTASDYKEIELYYKAKLKAIQ